MVAVIGTWPFSARPVAGCYARLVGGKCSVAGAVVGAIREVECDPEVHSVGAYSWPNAVGVLQQDAAIIEVSPGRHQCGAVLALEGYVGAIDAAFTVMESCPHRILVGPGAAKFLEERGLLPSPDPIPHAVAPLEGGHGAAADASHDTVGIVAVRDGVLVVGCSTSGKRNKVPGRVGDSPIFGSGLYAEGEVGGAVCTGDGDLICSFPLAFTVVSLMRSGLCPQSACEEAMKYFLSLPQGEDQVEAAVVALNVRGEGGAACSPAYLRKFEFAYCDDSSGGEVVVCGCA